MKIGIIGAGNIGGTLTRRFTALGYEVAVANSRGPETLGELAEETGASPVSVGEAALDADVVVITIPASKVPNLPVGFLDGAAKDVVVIDTCNYYPQQRDGRIAEIEDGMTESRWVANQIGFPGRQGIQWHPCVASALARQARRRATPHCLARGGRRRAGQARGDEFGEPIGL